MKQDMTFTYSYSAKENEEVQAIRKKYLPQEESRLEEMRRLDGIVRNSGMIESLGAGILGCLVFGLGLCLVMRVFGNGVILTRVGVLLGAVGVAGMLAAYPIYRRVFGKAKKKYAPRILALADELSSGKR